VKSLSLINSLRLPINLRVKFKNDDIHIYTCSLPGCKIINVESKGSYNSTIPITEITFMVPQLGFAQTVDMTTVKGVKEEFFQLTSKLNVDPKLIERAFNAASKPSDDFEENLRIVGNVPLISINDMNSFDNDNRYLILKRIVLKKKKSSRHGRLLQINDNKD
jgi:hypothetical protein